jgi:hypothetical protein
MALGPLLSLFLPTLFHSSSVLGPTGAFPLLVCISPNRNGNIGKKLLITHQSKVVNHQKSVPYSGGFRRLLILTNRTATGHKPRLGFLERRRSPISIDWNRRINLLSD